MSTYLFILGKDRELSLAELIARFPVADVKALGTDFVALNLKEDFSQSDLDQLGGIIKVAKLITSVNFKAVSGTLFDILSARCSDKKMTYGVSVYDWPQNHLREILFSLKKAFKQNNFKTRFANQDYKNISVAQFKGFRKNGIELLVAKDSTCLLVGEVVAVQDIDSYSRRDYDKPFRDMQVGMLPPKLAQILINLTGVRQGHIWDPFCGGGVLIMEGSLMGYDMLGSDIDEKTLEGAKRNMEWLRMKSDLFHHDATTPLLGKLFDAIACEGYLGPPQKRKHRIAEYSPLIHHLERLYIGFFEALKESQFKGPIVIALPFFKTIEGRDVLMEDTIEKIQNMGFELTSFLPRSLAGHNCFILKYSRADQVVGRAIYRFYFK